MGKWELIVEVFLAIVLVFIISVPMIFANGSPIAKIDQKVIDDISKTGQSEVIVMLKETASYSSQSYKKVYEKEKKLLTRNDIEAIKSENKKLVKKVLSDLNDEASKNKKSRKKSTKKYVSSGFQLSDEFSYVPGFSGVITSSGLEKLKNNPNVEKIYKNMPQKLELMRSIPLIRANQVWDIEVNGIKIDGTGETICHVDSGIHYERPELGGCLGPGCKVIGGYDFVRNDDDPNDETGHGTETAAIIIQN